MGEIVANILYTRLYANFETFQTKTPGLTCQTDGLVLGPATSDSSHQTNFRQKWLKIGTNSSEYIILYNMSVKSPDFFKKKAHVNTQR